MDVVRYNDKAPWPVEADGLGGLLERLDSGEYGNDPINWRASPGTPSPGFDNLANRPPLVNAGPDQTLMPRIRRLRSVWQHRIGRRRPCSSRRNWTWVSGPGPVWFDNSAQTNTTAYFPGIGAFTLRLTATDGLVQVSDEVTFIVQHQRSSLTLVRGFKLEVPG